MDGGSGIGRISAAARRLSAPRSLKATNVAAGGVTLKWTAPKGAKPAHYWSCATARASARPRAPRTPTARSRPGHDLPVHASARARRAQAARARCSSERAREGARRPQPARAAPRADDQRVAADRDGHADAAEPTAATPPAIAATPTPTAPPTATPTAHTHATTAARRPTPPPDRARPTAMVDRLFWRAGFGPTQAQRDAWTGKQARRARRLVPEHAERARRPTTPPPLTYTDGEPIDPIASDIELELEWIDRMQRAINPLPGPAGVLLAPPLGDQPRRGRHPDPVGHQLPRPAAPATPTSRATRTRRSGSWPTR